MIFAENPITHQHPTTADETLHPSLKQEVEEEAVHWFHRFIEWWHVGAEVLLLLRIIMEIWEVVRFFLYEYGGLVEKLALHNIEKDEVDILLGKAIVNSLFAIINILLTIRLRKLKGSIASTLDLLGETTLLLASPALEYYFKQLHILAHLADWIF